jgi:hypothetical protein
MEQHEDKTGQGRRRNAHKAVAFERGAYGHDGSQKGYAASCETCGAVTFGGFRTKTDAKGALEHSDNRA